MQSPHSSTSSESGQRNGTPSSSGRPGAGIFEEKHSAPAPGAAAVMQAYNELEELKRYLRSKSFALDDVVPLARRAAGAIDQLQEENMLLRNELLRYRESELQLKSLTEAIGSLIVDKNPVDLKQACRSLLTGVSPEKF